jgi:lipopolysaccharide export system permease protein
MRTLLYDIRVAKPAFDIKEGIFYDKLDGYTIKIGKKLNDSVVQNILVYESNNGLQDNLIVAQEGTMSFAADQNLLAFNLKNGWRYSEKGNERTKNTEFYRIGFKHYKKVFDISSFKLSKTADSTFKNHYRMLSYRQLNYIADSLERIADEKRSTQLLTIQQTLPRTIEDSVWTKQSTNKKVNFTNIYSTIPDSLKGILNNTITGRISSLKSQAELLKYDSQEAEKELRLYRMEQHKKISLSFACVVFFFIGAPLGILTRKGGIGLPLVISVLFFIIFHIINTSGEKLVKEGVLDPLSGMWLSSFILIPIGTLLMVKARKDGAVFNVNKWFVLWNKLKKQNPKS